MMDHYYGLSLTIVSGTGPSFVRGWAGATGKEGPTILSHSDAKEQTDLDFEHSKQCLCAASARVAVKKGSEDVVGGLIFLADYSG